MIEVEGPGGVVVEFPDGTSRDVMTSAMQKKFSAPASSPVPAAPAPEASAAPAASTQPSLMDKIFPRYGLAHEVANGMTFGTYPNIEAGVIAGVEGLKNALGVGNGKSIADNYSDDLKSAQDARRSFRGQAPIVSATADAAGGFATGGALARNGVTLIGRMTNEGLGNLLPRMAAAGTEGALYGAAAGAGGSEGDFSDRLKAAAQNVPVGAFLGGASVPAIDYAIKPAANFVSNIYGGFRDPQGQGRDMLVQSIMRDRVTPETMAQRIETAAAAGQPEYMAMDAGGKNTARLNKLAGRTPGTYRDEVTRTLDARQGDAAACVGNFVDEAAGGGPTARQHETAIGQSRTVEGQQMYDRAYAHPAPQGQFYDDMMQRPSVQQAMQTVERTAAENQMPLSDLFTEVPNPNARTVTNQVPSSVLGADGQPVMRAETTVENPTIRIPTTRGWDMIKRSLDTQVDAGFRSTDAAQRTAAAATRQTRDALRQQLGTDNPDYLAALQRFGDTSTAANAITAGRDVVARPSTATREAVDAVPPGQRDLASAGSAEAFRDKLDRTTSGQDVTRIFDSNNARAALDRMSTDPVARAVLGDAGSSSARSGRLGREQDMAATRRMMAGGSDTAENLVDQAPASLLNGLGLTLTGQWRRGPAMLAEAIGNAGRGMNENTAREIGDYLATADPARIRSLQQLFEASQQRAMESSAAPAMISAFFNAPRQRSDQRR